MSKLNVSDRKEVIGYLRVSTDYQDIGKQRDTISHWARREKLKITKFIEGGEISSSKSMTARKLDFLSEMKNGDTLVATETSRISRTVQELLSIVDDNLSK